MSCYAKQVVIQINRTISLTHFLCNMICFIHTKFLRVGCLLTHLRLIVSLSAALRDQETSGIEAFKDNGGLRNICVECVNAIARKMKIARIQMALMGTACTFAALNI